jgi:thiosulfate dehydrogenase
MNRISREMCHHDVANTHPYIHHKFQMQLKEVVLLGDMINWCMEDPLEGKTLAKDDP